MSIATFGTGCFWCTEAVFQQLKGVISAVSGYSGGQIENPSYEQVSTGQTGHAEVCQIEFNPDQVSFEALLEVFFSIHDPTTLNRKGNDVGPQYRSVIFYHDEEQRETAERVKTKLEANKTFKKPIVTEITAFSKFYPAEDYHQNYFRNNPNQGYCRYVIAPKLDKFEKVFKLKLGKTS
jgi:peptide-methionine (S)-S-oxide reductase